MNFQGAKVLITGAAQGLGKAFTEALLSRGASVCITDVQLNKGRELERELQRKYGDDKAMFLQCDVGSEEHLTKTFNTAVSKLGPIDLMVNNAGIADESRGRDMVDINLMGVIKGTELAIKHMRKDKGGKGGVVVNVASTAGLTPLYLSPVYTATKFGVVGFTQSWAHNPLSQAMSVQFACLCPAFTRTAMIDFDQSKLGGQSDEEAQQILKVVGVNEVSDVVQGFLMLLSDRKCNGDVVSVVKGEGATYKKKNGRSVRPKL